MRTTGGVVDRGRCGGRLRSEGRPGPCWIASAAALSCCTASSSRSQVVVRPATALPVSTCTASSVSVPRCPLQAMAVLTRLATQPGALLPIMIFLMAQKSPLWPVDRRPPGLLAIRSIAPDLDVTVACALGGRTVAWYPGDRDSARLPGMVETALCRTCRTSHLVSRTQFRVGGLLLSAKVLRSTSSLDCWPDLIARKTGPGSGDSPRRFRHCSAYCPSLSIPRSCCYGSPDDQSVCRTASANVARYSPQSDGRCCADRRQVARD